MRTDNELQQMSHDELIEQVKGLQFQLAVWSWLRKRTQG